MFRTGPRGYFISENYFIQTQNGSTLIITAGGKSIIKTIGLDYGLVFPVVEEFESFFALPWLGITIPFGNHPKAKTSALCCSFYSSENLKKADYKYPQQEGAWIINLAKNTC